MVFGPRRAAPLLAVGLATLVALGLAVLLVLRAVSGASRSRGPSASPQMGPILVTVNTRAPGRRVPFGFLGLSLEYPSVERYAGADPSALDPVFVQLVRNLAPGQAPVLRIGGDTADRTWWPTLAVARPPGVTFAITSRWLEVTRALATTLRARLVLGLNLEADSPSLAAAEAHALLGGIGAGRIRALELGNEPDLYATFPWYRTPSGQHVPGRPPSYDISSLIDDFTRFAAALPQRRALAGPSLGAPAWMRYLGRFLDTEPRVGLVTLHRYPLQLCFTSRRSPRYPTVAHLLLPGASFGLADSFAPYAAIAHTRRLSLRIDELNSVSCGADPAVSQTFASALWALDTLFEMVRVGIHGVNIHTFPGAGYQLFRVGRIDGRWEAAVAPEYYGLMLFARAAPPGSRLLSVRRVTAAALDTWATEDRHGNVRIVVINREREARLVLLRVEGGRFARARLERLSAPSLLSRGDVTLGGQSFGVHTFTGWLSGALQSASVKVAGGRCVIDVPAAGAQLLVLSPRPTRVR